jgi:hypothetical protein
LLGRFSGNTLPSSFTSAVGGNLTFRFTSDNIVVDKGWIATISCVPLTLLQQLQIMQWSRL